MKLQFFCSALSLRKTLWTGTLLLLLTACNSGTKAASGEGAGSETSSSVLIGDGNDNDPATYGISDANDTTALTVTLQSLILSLDKTSFNKDENTTVKVTARYEDGTSKDVTDKVEWIVNPKGSVAVTQKTLTAKKDNQTTIKAKVGNKLSNTINLNIIWTVNGHTLPPEPDKALNDSTLLGIDINNNGVRDDVERWIYDRYKDEHPIMIPLRMQTSRAYQKIIVDPSKAKETYHFMDNQMNCEWAFTSLSANYFGRKPLVLIESEDSIKEDKEMKYVQYNTTQRARAYGLYNQTLSGGVYGDDGPEDGWIENCDFNTTIYIEMSEKL